MPAGSSLRQVLAQAVHELAEQARRRAESVEQVLLACREQLATPAHRPRFQLERERLEIVQVACCRWKTHTKHDDDERTVSIQFQQATSCVCSSGNATPFHGFGY